MTDVTVSASAHEIAVRIKGTPHLLLRRAAILSVQGWKMSVGVAVPYYIIEIVMNDHEVTCEYDDRTLWEAILSSLANARIFDQRLGAAS